MRKPLTQVIHTKDFPKCTFLNSHVLNSIVGSISLLRSLERFHLSCTMSLLLQIHQIRLVIQTLELHLFAP